MRILYVTQYYPPETGAGALRAREMVRAWREDGHDVRVVCAFPNYPAGRVAPEYRGRLYAREEHEGVPVLRMPIYTSEEKTFVTRLGNYGSFATTAFLGVLASERPDVVYVTSPPLPVGLAGLAARVKGVPYVFEVRDLWPDGARAFGQISEGRLYRAAKKFESRCYRHALRVVAANPAHPERLRERGVPTEKIIFGPNGANLKTFAAAADVALPCRKGGLRLFYGGLLGLQYAMLDLIEAMHLVRDLDVHLTVAGEGVKRAEMEAAIARHGLTNVTMLGQVPLERVPELLAENDVSVIPLGANQVSQEITPVKLYESWAAARPVIIGSQAVAARFVRDAGGGIAYPPEDIGSLAASIRWMYHAGADAVAAMGMAGKAHVQTYDRGVIARRILSEVQAALSGASVTVPSTPLQVEGSGRSQVHE